MELDLTKIKSLVEYVFATTYGLGKTPSSAGISQSDAWGQTQDPNSFPFTIREFRDMIAQVLYDILSDATSSGGNLSSQGSFGGGNKTPGTGKYYFKAGSTVYEISTTKHTLTGNTEITGDLDVSGSGKVLKVEGVQVVKSQESAIADATTSHSLSGSDTLDRSDTETAINNLGTKINTILGALRNHGLIDT